ncbi:MAG: hypothetical protein IPO35_02510 [Uliginosibacterium sp.]|nr:hypothetical protein [Uliginosibacterium sp.]MBK9614420.1 hypothetical protein [Uliginosibacterium sp.]
MDPAEPVRPTPCPEPPTPPGEGECCESECGEACVWARYRAALDQYRRATATPPNAT